MLFRLVAVFRVEEATSGQLALDRDEQLDASDVAGVAEMKVWGSTSKNPRSLLSTLLGRM